MRLINGQNYHTNQFKVRLTVEKFILVSGNAAPGEILRFSLTDGGMIYRAASELLQNKNACWSSPMHGNMEHCQGRNSIH